MDYASSYDPTGYIILCKLFSFINEKKADTRKSSGYINDIYDNYMDEHVCIIRFLIPAITERREMIQ